MSSTAGRMIFIVLAILVGFGTQLSADSSKWLSPSAMVADPENGIIYIAYGKASEIAVFDAGESKVTGKIEVRGEPVGLALGKDKSVLYCTCDGERGGVCIIDIKARKVTSVVDAGYGACSPVVSPDGKRLYVCNRYEDSVSVIDINSGKTVKEIKVLREPVAAAVTADGKWLFVGNHLPDGPATADIVSAQISVIDTSSMECERTISLPNGSTSLNGIAVSPDGQYVFVTHILGRYTVPTTQLERGWINTNALSILDAKSRQIIETVLLDDVDRGAANPWAVGCTGDSKYVCVTHAGTDELSVVDVEAMMKKIAERHAKAKEQGNTGYSGSSYGSASGSEIPNELSFLYGMRQRVKLSGKGARSIALVGTKVYAGAYFTASINIVDIADVSRIRPKAIELGSSEEMTIQRRGEMLFNDASICFQHWQSCASCHPGNARTDALNWDLLNDGLGNPKNTKSLLLSHQTPPAMMSGVRANAEEAVRAGVKHIHFAVRPEEEAVAMDEYLKSLKPLMSPYLVDGKLSESATRGKEVFNKAGCISCHSGELHTNLRHYDVGTGQGLDEGKDFDTPTLVEVWRTSPYLYDGRAATIKDVLTKYNSENKHGKTAELSEAEIKDLVAFVLSL